MPIDINIINNLQARTSEKPMAENAEANKLVDRNQQQTREATTKDTVQLTDRAQGLQKLAQEISKLPVVDTERVDTIRRMLDEGKFEIDASRVAEKILAMEQNPSDADSQDQKRAEEEA